MLGMLTSVCTPITLLWIALEVFVLYLTDFKDLTRLKQIAILAAAAFVATVGGVSECRQNRQAIQDSDTISQVKIQSDTQTNQTDVLNHKIDKLQDQINKSNGLLAVVAKNQADTAKPGLKKQALELSSTLLRRATQIQIWMLPHPGGRCTGGPNSAMHLDPNSLTFTTMQQEWEKCNAKLIKAQTDAAGLISDYNTTYANQILGLRDSFMAE